MMVREALESSLEILLVDLLHVLENQFVLILSQIFHLTI